eukprot:SAG11_NODE_93_length_17080_cov_10.504093_15_plen_131_part_00
MHNEMGVPDPIPIPGSPTLKQLIFIPPPVTKTQLVSVLKAMNDTGIVALVEKFGSPIFDAMLKLGAATMGAIVMPEVPEISMPNIGLDMLKKLGLPSNVFSALKNLDAAILAKIKEMEPMQLAIELWQLL